MRIKGIGEEDDDMLEKNGVDTVIELSRRDPKELHKKLGEKYFFSLNASWRKSKEKR